MGLVQQLNDTWNSMLKYTLTPTKLECCDPNNTSPATKQEAALALTLHWMRIRKKNLDWCSLANCYPGPTGYKVKGKGWWVPAPREACLYPVTVNDMSYNRDAEKMDWKVQPFAWWHHCKSYEHCLFLVRSNRLHALRVPQQPLVKIAGYMETGAIPALVDDRDFLCKAFLLDWMDGRVDADIDRRLQLEQPVQEEAPCEVCG